MNFYKWLGVIGGVLLVCGLLMAFVSGHYTERVMSEARRGVTVSAPNPDSPDGRRRESLLWWADFWFYIGLVVTAIGGILLSRALILSRTIVDSKIGNREI